MLRINQETGSGAAADRAWNWVPPGSAQEWVHKAESAFQEGDLEQAAREFEKAVELNPYLPDAHNGLSVVLWRQGRVEEALNSLTRAMELAPNDRDVILNCAEAFKSVGKVDDAAEILNSFLINNPGDPEVAVGLEGLHSPEAAVGGAAAVPRVAEMLNDQGRDQFTKGRVERARMCFEMALEHHPDYADALSNLGVVSMQEGRLEEALEHFLKALDLDSSNTDVIYNSAKALVASGELETGAGMLRAYLQRQPSDEEAWNEYDELLRQSGSAMDWQSNGLPSETADVYLEMGKKLAEAGDTMGAAQAFLRVTQIDGLRAEAWYELGRLHEGLDQSDEAVEMFRGALGIDPAHKDSVLAVGRVLNSSGLGADARDVYLAYLAEKEDPEIREALEAVTSPE
jgi:Flp pilus assembly protein TadD